MPIKCEAFDRSKECSEEVHYKCECGKKFKILNIEVKFICLQINKIEMKKNHKIWISNSENQ